MDNVELKVMELVLSSASVEKRAEQVAQALTTFIDDQLPEGVTPIQFDGDLNLEHLTDIRNEFQELESLAAPAIFANDEMFRYILAQLYDWCEYCNVKLV